MKRPVLARRVRREWDVAPTTRCGRACSPGTLTQLDRDARLSAASKKLDIPQEAGKDAFVDRTLVDERQAKLDAFLASLSPAQRAYTVDIPKSVHESRHPT